MDILAEFLAGGLRCPLCEEPFVVSPDWKPPHWSLCRRCGGIFVTEEDGTHRRLTRSERAKARDSLQSADLAHVRDAHEKVLRRRFG